MTGLGMLAIEVDGVEAALGGADAAAYAAVFVHNRCAATEAAGCFLPHLLLRERPVILLEVILVTTSQADGRQLAYQVIRRGTFYRHRPENHAHANNHLSLRYPTANRFQYQSKGEKRTAHDLYSRHC